MPARTDNAEVKNRAWIVYPVVAVAATVVYYVLGHNSYLFNVIGLTSPVLIWSRFTCTNRNAGRPGS